MSEFHITGDEVYYEGHLVARLLPMSATVRANVEIEFENMNSPDEDGEAIRGLKEKLFDLESEVVRHFYRGPRIVKK